MLKGDRIEQAHHLAGGFDLDLAGLQGALERFPRKRLGQQSAAVQDQATPVRLVQGARLDQGEVGLQRAQMRHVLDAANQAVDAYGERGLVRSHIPCFDVFGQPGTWQDATCLVGVERLSFLGRGTG